MNGIDDELIHTLTSLYEGELDEDTIVNKLKSMTVTQIIDIKNALSNDYYEQVDKFMGIKLDESIYDDFNYMLKMSGLNSLHEAASSGATSAGSIASVPGLLGNKKPKKIDNKKYTKPVKSLIRRYNSND